MHCMKNTQLTLRMDRDLIDAIEKAARGRRVPKAQVVREAIEAYIADKAAATDAGAWQRVESMVGSLSLDRAAQRRDALARQLRAHNWRKE
jgi:hypothetical protein